MLRVAKRFASTGFQEELVKVLPSVKVETNPLRLLAIGTDASFYRLTPKLVIHLQSEQELRSILPLALKHQTPVTFRAAGTSLSGQAVTDSVLIKIQPDKWKAYSILSKGQFIQVQPGLIGGEVNQLLKAYKKKIGPDPASIDSCMIGGIAANNASGMCCGTAQNSYHTIRDARLVFADGSVLDTADKESCHNFRTSHTEMISRIAELHHTIHQNPDLVQQITKKFAIKCTTGYSLNAFVDYSDPIEIIKHLTIGSEGTLNFISNITYKTVPEQDFKATSLVIFPDMHSACEAAMILKQSGLASAAELMDRAALRSTESQTSFATASNAVKSVAAKFSDSLRFLNENAAGLLIELRDDSQPQLKFKMQSVVDLITNRSKLNLVNPIEFSEDPMVCKFYWDIRKGLASMVGGMRPTGSTFLLEDVAAEISSLAAMSLDVKKIFHSLEYHDAILFGHALDGNLHLVFSQMFQSPNDIDRYRKLMDSLCDIVANKYQGSLKAEHGTGRNIAPFVEMEWGPTAYEIMWKIKRIFDPKGILNPGVILNENPTVHLENIKPLTATHPLVDKCIECGFCESVCPSRNVTLTPRQRIVVQREIARAKEIGDNQLLEQLLVGYSYDVKDTCAADGMCQEKCPVGINTGALVKVLRDNDEEITDKTHATAQLLASKFQYVALLARLALNAASLAHRVIGEGALVSVNKALREVSPPGTLPMWNKYIPAAAKIPDRASLVGTVNPANPNRVIYFPSCLTRIFGTTPENRYKESLESVTVKLLKKGNYQVIYPENVDSLCCGLSLASKGLASPAELLSTKVLDELYRISEAGKIPIICDSSPCVHHIRETIQTSDKYRALQFAVFEPVEFICCFVENHLEWAQVFESILLHVPCSIKKLKMQNDIERLAQKCAKEVINSGVSCCGMAGDRGLRYPELGTSACEPLHRALVGKNPVIGFSTSTTCEIQMANQSKINFSSILHLFNAATSTK